MFEENKCYCAKYLTFPLYLNCELIYIAFVQLSRFLYGKKGKEKMNKLFSKIAAASVGLAMAVGVGVAVGGHAGAVKASGTAISASELQSGDKCFITAAGKVLKAGAAFASKKSGDVTATYDGEGLSESDAWLFTKTGDVWTITTVVEEETLCLYVTNDNNGLVCAAKDPAATWTIEASEEEATTSFLTSSDGSNTRYLALYETAPNFRCYKNTSSGVPQIQLYKYTASSKTVSSLSVVSNPTKVSYSEGDALDLTGVSVKAIWSDSSETDVTSDAIYSPANGAILSSSNTQVTVTYGGKSTSFAISVAAKVFATHDVYITADLLGLTTSYSSSDVSVDVDGDAFTFGRADVMKGINNYAGTIQFKASTGKLFNKSKFSAPISKVYFLADADNSFAPSNWAVYGSADTAGSTASAMDIVTVDETNKIYSVDFTASPTYFFTVAKTGSYATYFDMIVVELVHSADDVAAVRTAAAGMLNVFADFCSAEKGPSAEQWNSIKGFYTGLTDDQKAIFDATVTNSAACSSEEPSQAPVQATDLQKAVQKVDYCVAAYGVENFTGRVFEASLINHPVETSSSNTIIIIIAATFAITAFGAVLLIRKKRHSK